MRSLVERLWRRWRSDRRGQSLTEYGLILALIAIVVIGALTALGGNLNSLFCRIVGTLGGSC